MTSKGRYVLQSLLGDNPLQKLLGSSSKEGQDEEKQQQHQQEEQQRKMMVKHKHAMRKRKIKELSSLANSVISECARILSTTPVHLQTQYETLLETQAGDASAATIDPLDYGRGLVMLSFIKAMSIVTRNEDFLNDKDFRRLTFDAMVAWEAPKATTEPATKDEEYESAAKENEDDDGDQDSSLFYSDLMPLLAESENTIGLEAFVRIAPFIPVVADVITVHEQFEALTFYTGHRLPYPQYDKYIGALDKSAKDMKNKANPLLESNFAMMEGEFIIGVDGVSQKVIQHIGSSSVSGRLTLTNRALYFEESGMVSYQKPYIYDLSLDLDHDIRRDLTGPWGSRIFDKAVSYKTSLMDEGLVFEFPEVTGSMRRDYWYAIIREIIYAHKFIRQSQLEGPARSEALARAVLGILRLKATRECFQVLPAYPERLLTFSLADEYPNGDLILEVFAQLLASARCDLENLGAISIYVHHMGIAVWHSAIHVLRSMGIFTVEANNLSRMFFMMGECRITELMPLEVAVQNSREKAKQVDRAKMTVEEVKVEGIGTNVAVMNELVVPGMRVIFWINDILSWREPFKSTFFFVLFSIIIYRGWLRYTIPAVLNSICAYIIWLRATGRAERCREVLVPTPSGGVSLDQVVTVQRALSQVQDVLQFVNITLLKIWSLCLSTSTQATNLMILATIALSIALVTIPFRFVALAAFVSIFTSQLMKKTDEGRGKRRLRELWHGIPVIPVRFVESEEETKREAKC